MKQYLIVVAIIAFGVPAFGESHVTNTFSLTIAPGMYKQDPAMFPDMNTPGAGLVVVGNEAFDNLKKGGEIIPSEPLCWTVITTSEEVGSFENSPVFLASYDKGFKSGFGNTKVENYQSSFVNKYNRNCVQASLLMYEGDLPINVTVISVPTVSGLVIISSNSTEKTAGDSFYNLVQSSMAITADEPKSNASGSGIAKIAGGLISVIIGISLFARKR
ncbi:MAG: hypothetical protein ABIH86_04935 [Planctomycetota bacterium]